MKSFFQNLVSGHDRTTLTLADTNMVGTTDAITKAVNASKLILTVVVGEPVALEHYVDQFGVILLALEGGQAAGIAFAEVIFGMVNPSGALPFTMLVANPELTLFLYLNIDEIYCLM